MRVLQILFLLTATTTVASAQCTPPEPVFAPTDNTKTVIRKGFGEYGAPRQTGSKHSGVDLVALASYPSPGAYAVVAVSAGTVAYARFNGAGPNKGYGNVVVIDHGNGCYSLYGHLASDPFSAPSTPLGPGGHLLVSVGDRVSAGQLIGYFVNVEADIASSGNAMVTSRVARHQLHFELIEAPSGRTSGESLNDSILRSDGHRIDPTPLLQRLGFKTYDLDAAISRQSLNLQGAVWVASSEGQVLKGGDASALPILRYALQLHEAHVPSSDMSRYLDYAQKIFAGDYSGIADSDSSIWAGKTGVPFPGLPEISNQTAPTVVLANGEALRADNSNASALNDVLEQLYSASRSDTALDTAISTYIAPKYLHFDTKASLDEMIAHSPELSKLSSWTKLQELATKPNASVDDYEALVQTRLNSFTHDLSVETEKARATASMTVDDFQELGKQNKGALSDVAKQFTTHAQELSMLTSLLALTGNSQVQKFAHDAEVIGSSALKLNKALANFNLGNLSTATLTSDVVGSVMPISSLFGGSGPEPQLMSALQAIQQQLSQLRQEMHQRFDIVDRKLDMIMDGVNKNYETLMTLNANVAAIQQQLVTQAAALATLQQTVVDDFSALVDLQISDKRIHCLEYKQTYVPRMEFRDYADCLGSYYGFAVDAARSPLKAGDLRQALTDDQLIKMSKAPLEGSIRYFLRWSNSLNVTHIGDRELQDLPNPGTWKLGVEGYMAFASDWPQHFYKETKPARQISNMEQEGAALESALADLAGHSPEDRKQHLHAFVANYLKAAKALADPLAKQESQYRTNAVQSILGADTGYKLKLQQVRACPGFTFAQDRWSGPNREMNLPFQFGDAIPNLFKNAERVGVGNFSICYFRFERGAAVPSDHSEYETRFYFRVLLGDKSLGEVAGQIVSPRADVAAFSEAEWTCGCSNSLQDSVRANVIALLAQPSVLQNVIEYAANAVPAVTQNASQNLARDLRQGGSLAPLLVQLESSKALLKMYLELTNPGALESREDLRYYVEGAGLLDSIALTASLDCLASGENSCTPAAAALSQAIRSGGLSKEITARSDAFQVLSSHLPDGPQSTQAVLRTTLAELRAFQLQQNAVRNHSFRVWPIIASVIVVAFLAIVVGWRRLVARWLNGLLKLVRIGT